MEAIIDVENLLLEIFGVDELRAFLSRLPTSDRFNHTLPIGPVSKAEYFHAVVTALERHGLLGHAFFDLLREHRPARGAVIEELRTRVIRVSIDESRLPPMGHAARNTTHNLPPRMYRTLLGREPEVSILRDAFSSDMSNLSPRAIVVTGLGGIGKSALAYEYATLSMELYQVILWVNCSDVTLPELREKLGGLCGVLGLPTHPHLEGRLDALFRYLERAERSLLILDDLTETGFWQIVPPTYQLDVLITSRRRDLICPATELHLGRLSEDNALALLVGDLALSESDRRDAKCIVAELEGHPLAIDMSRGILRSGAIRIPHLLERLRQVDVLDVVKQPGRTPPYHSSLTALMDVSLSLLNDADRVDRLARRLLWVLGWFHSDPVPFDLLARAAMGLPGITFWAVVRDTLRVPGSRGAASERSEAGLYQGRLALGRLSDLCLISVSGEGYAQAHSIVRAYSRLKSGHRGRHAVLSTLEEFVRELPNDPVQLVRNIEPIQGHISTIIDQLSGEEGSRQKESEVWLALRLAQFERANGRAERALTICEKASENARSDMLAALDLESAEALASLGRFDDALEMVQRAKSRDAGVRSSTGTAHAAICAGRMGRIILSQALSDLGQSGGGPGSGENGSVFRLAKEHLEEALQAQSGNLPPEHPEALSVRIQLARALLETGDTDNALPMVNMALEDQIRALGATHPDVADGRIVLGLCRVVSGQVQLGLADLDAAVRIAESSFGNLHPATAEASFAYASGLAATNENEKAQENFTRAYDIQLAVFGPAHPTTRRTQRFLQATSPGAEVLTALADSNPIQMLAIPAGSFLMGSARTEYGRHDGEGPQHRVFLHEFALSATPITQAQYFDVMEVNPSNSHNPEAPVICISWYDACEFCNRLSLREGRTPTYEISGRSVAWNAAADGFRLPTEAEWEYACRAGSSTRFSNGDEDDRLDAIAWYRNNSRGELPAVAKREANRWGLYDMHGTVWEWVWDRYDRFTDLAMTNPAGPAEGEGRGPLGGRRTIRGGSYLDEARWARSASRLNWLPWFVWQRLGFRVALSASLLRLVTVPRYVQK